MCAYEVAKSEEWDFPLFLLVKGGIIGLSKTTDRIEEAIFSTVADLGYRIVDIEIGRENGNKVLTVYISCDGGVSLDDCETVSRAIDPILDELDPIADPYYLCVSSPGIDRPLKRQADFEQAIGKEVEVGLYKAAYGKKKHTGVLISYDPESGIVIRTEQGELAFELSDVSRVRPVVVFD